MTNKINWYKGKSDTVLAKLSNWIKWYKYFLDENPDGIYRSPETVKVSRYKLVLIDPAAEESISIPTRLIFRVQFTINELEWLLEAIYVDDLKKEYEISSTFKKALDTLQLSSLNNLTSLWIDLDLKDLEYLRDYILIPIKNNQPTFMQAKKIQEDAAKGDW